MLKRLLAGLMTVALVAWIAPVSAALVTFGFTGSGGCTFGCPPDFDGNVTGRFTIDTEAADTDADPNVGEYRYTGGGTGMSINIGNLTLYFSEIRVRMYNDQVGPWECQQAVRDAVHILAEDNSGNRMFGIFDSCDLDALTSDAALHEADMDLLDGYSTGPNEGLVVHSPGLELIGDTIDIFRVPEPTTPLLLALPLLYLLRSQKRTTKP